MKKISSKSYSVLNLLQVHLVGREGACILSTPPLMSPWLPYQRLDYTDHIVTVVYDEAS